MPKLSPLFFALTSTLILSLAAPAGAVTSAELYRPSGHTFGKFEARVRFAAGEGVISSFFLWKEGSELSTVYWNELDFEKLGADCELQTNSIYGLPQTNHEGHGYALAGLCDGYHTYAYEWTPESIVWFVDGVEIRRETGEHATAYAENATDGLQFRFNIWPGNANFGGVFSEAILPVYQFIAWAQYSAYTPGTGDNGSNFTLSWREEFDALPAGWAMGSWASPLNGSTHSARNVSFVEGVAVLALTADDATGFVGSPPPDTEGAGGTPTAGGAGGMTGAAVGGTSAASTGGVAATSADDEGSDGCSCRVPAGRSFGWGSAGLLVGALLLRRRQLRRCSGSRSRRS